MRETWQRVRAGVWTTIRREDGTSMVEYGLMILLIAAVAVVAVTGLGTSIVPMFSSAAAGF